MLGSHLVLKTDGSCELGSGVSHGSKVFSGKVTYCKYFIRIIETERKSFSLIIFLYKAEKCYVVIEIEL